MQMTDATYSPHVLAYDVLVFSLTLKRPHAGRGVQKLVKYLSAKFPTARADGFGNLHVDTRKDATNRTLFVAHLDTVHRQDGKNHIEHKGGSLLAVNDVLGADDGAGIALLAHLITSNVPAYYIFTHGEECGGLGAKHLTVITQPYWLNLTALLPSTAEAHRMSSRIKAWHVVAPMYSLRV